MITGVDFVLVPVTDLDRARDFYGNVLGLKPGKVWGSDTRPTLGAEYETGTVTIALLDVAKVGMEHTPQRFGLALQVEDVAEARAKLEAKGVEFQRDDLDSGVCWQAFFADPDGNGLILHHRYAPAPAPQG